MTPSEYIELEVISRAPRAHVFYILRRDRLLSFAASNSCSLRPLQHWLTQRLSRPDRAEFIYLDNRLTPRQQFTYLASNHLEQVHSNSLSRFYTSSSWLVFATRFPTVGCTHNSTHRTSATTFPAQNDYGECSNQTCCPKHPCFIYQGFRLTQRCAVKRTGLERNPATCNCSFDT